MLFMLSMVNKEVFGKFYFAAIHIFFRPLQGISVTCGVLS